MRRYRAARADDLFEIFRESFIECGLRPARPRDGDAFVDGAARPFHRLDQSNPARAALYDDIHTLPDTLKHPLE